MTRSSVTLFGLLFFAAGCGEGDREPLPPVDCSVEEDYAFKNIQDFSPGQSYIFQYGDPTPGSTPGPSPEGDVPVPLDLEPRCGDARYVKLIATGENFWGAGFGDWSHNDPMTQADGTDCEGAPCEGISLWARSPRYAEKTFLFGVDDLRTIIDPTGVPECPPEMEARNCMGPDDDRLCCDAAWRACRPLPAAVANDQDLDGDGCLGPGDIVNGNAEGGTRCRLPPSSEIGTAVCYNGAVDSPPSGGTRVPEPDECGNQFHTWVTTTERWQFFTIPWSEIVQWPCPNRLEGGIDRAKIAKYEIKLKQGMNYEIWLDNIKFYRRK
jgi:hypothetical protein